jgi:hypothetical protein
MRTFQRLALVLTAAMGGIAAGACDDGEARGATDTDADADTDTDSDSDADGDTDAEACAASGSWYDTATDLCWQNPPSDDELTWENAAAYCDSLSLGGYDDWRLPEIEDLVSLIRGCVDQIETGDLSPSDCAVTNTEAPDEDCVEADCWGCMSLEGPDDDPAGCYWDPALQGMCDTSYWSSSGCTDGLLQGAWVVSFQSGRAYSNAAALDYYSRCVRSGQ